MWLPAGRTDQLIGGQRSEKAAWRAIASEMAPISEGHGLSYPVPAMGVMVPPEICETRGIWPQALDLASRNPQSGFHVERPMSVAPRADPSRATRTGVATTVAQAHTTLVHRARTGRPRFT